MAEKNILRNKKVECKNRRAKVVSQLFFRYKGPSVETPRGFHSYHHSMDSYCSFPFITSVESLENNNDAFKTPDSSQFRKSKSVNLETLLNIRRVNICSIGSRKIYTSNILTRNYNISRGESTHIENEPRKNLILSSQENQDDEGARGGSVLEDSVFKKPNSKFSKMLTVNFDATPINTTKPNIPQTQQLKTPTGKITSPSNISSTIKKDKGQLSKKVSRPVPMKPRHNLCRLGSSGDRRTASPPRITSRDIHQIKLKIRIGWGSFGSVYMGVFKDKIVAVKKLFSKMISKSVLLASFRAECNVLGLRHPHIVELLAAYTNQATQTLVIIMEYAGVKNLLNIINDSTEILNLKRIVRFTMEITEALHYIHEQGIMHLDLKPANVLITLFDRCKLGDFGCSKLVKNDRTYTFIESEGSASELNEVFFDSHTRQSFDFDALNFGSTSSRKESLEGTVIYKAPELLMGKVETFKCDIYSLGVTMWHLLFRQTPFKGKDVHSIIITICKLNSRPSMSFHEAKRHFEDLGNKLPFDDKHNRGNNFKYFNRIISTDPINSQNFPEIEDKYKKAIERCWEADADRRYNTWELLPLLASWLGQMS